MSRWGWSMVGVLKNVGTAAPARFMPPKIMMCVAFGVPGLTSVPSLPPSRLISPRDNGSKISFQSSSPHSRKRQLREAALDVRRDCCC